MAIIDATIGGASANSYNTEAALDVVADELFPCPNGWIDTTGDADARARLAITATRRLDLERFVRGRVTSDQALEWPRAGVSKPSVGSGNAGYGFSNGGSSGYYLPTEIPPVIQRAHALLTFYLAEQPTGFDPFGPPDDAGILSDNIGTDLQTTYEAGSNWVPPGARFMARVIRPMLAQFAVSYAAQPTTVRG